MKETIAKAAIRLTDGRVITADRPGRHSDVIRIVRNEGIKKQQVDDQGFVTDTGRFVDRSRSHPRLRLPRGRFCSILTTRARNYWMALIGRPVFTVKIYGK